MGFRFQIRRGISSEWASVNPLLLDGELAIEKDTLKFKIGNGVSKWKDLSYATQGIKGESVQFNWMGTKLGVKRDSDISFQYVDLRGEKGSTGTAGKEGAQGLHGRDGKKGEKGDKGEDGRGLVVFGTLKSTSELPNLSKDGDAYFIDGHLWVWSNGGFINTGNIKGEKGDAGSGIKILGTLNSISELPQTSKDGSAYFIDGHLWVWSENVFIDAGNIKGEKGDTGRRGERGEKGEGLVILGSLGSESELPSSGKIGDAYLIDGYLWVWSENRFVNAGSIKGEKGDTGRVGAQGIQGIQGIPGKDGKNGEKGERGAPGELGNNVTWGQFLK